MRPTLLFALAAASLALAAHAQPGIEFDGDALQGQSLGITDHCLSQAGLDVCPARPQLFELHATRSAEIEVSNGTATTFRLGCGGSITGPATFYGNDGKVIFDIAAGDTEPVNVYCKAKDDNETKPAPIDEALEQALWTMSLPDCGGKVQTMCQWRGR